MPRFLPSVAIVLFLGCGAPPQKIQTTFGPFVPSAVPSFGDTGPSNMLLQVPFADVDLSKDDATLSSTSNAAWGNFDLATPQLGALMPDLALPNTLGNMVTLSQFRGQGPVLLITGAASCPLFRLNAYPRLVELAALLSSLSSQPGPKLQMLMAYVQEPHPALDPSPYTDGTQWTTNPNVRDQILVREPHTFAEREGIAQAFSARYEIDPASTLIDGIDNGTWQTLGGVPNALYVIDIDGRVVFKEVQAFQTTSSDGTPAAFGQVRQLLGL